MNNLPVNEELLKQKGLDIARVSQLGAQTDFEVPVRISTATIVGTCSLGAFTYAAGGSEIRNATVGRFCSIAANVAIGPAEHPIDWLSSHPFAYDGVRYFDAHEDWRTFASRAARFRGNGRTTKVGNDVWIGRNVVVRQGVTVGDGAIIAAGSFVNHDVEPYTIVGGAPARTIRRRFSEELSTALVELTWWNWEIKPDVNGLDLTNPQATIEKLKTLIDSKVVEPFRPTVHRVTKTPGGYVLAAGDSH